MQDIQAAFLAAFNLIVSLDADLFDIVGLSLTVTLSAVGISCLLGFPLGLCWPFPGFPAGV